MTTLEVKCITFYVRVMAGSAAVSRGRQQRVAPRADEFIGEPQEDVGGDRVLGRIGPDDASLARAARCGSRHLADRRGESIGDGVGAAARPLWRSRAAVVVIAVAADAIAWMVATAGGVDLEVGLPGQAPREVTLVNVLVMTVLFSVLGWAARAVLDRIAKPRAAAGPRSR